MLFISSSVQISGGTVHSLPFCFAGARPNGCLVGVKRKCVWKEIETTMILIVGLLVTLVIKTFIYL